MDLKERIIAYMRTEAYKPLLAEDLAEEMGLTEEELIEFNTAIEELEQEGAIIKNRSDLYGVPSRMHLVVGRISMTAKGFGFIIPSDAAEQEQGGRDLGQGHLRRPRQAEGGGRRQPAQGRQGRRRL